MSFRMIRLAGASMLSLVTASALGAQLYTVPPTPPTPPAEPSPLAATAPLRAMTPAEFRDMYGHEYTTAVAAGGLDRSAFFGPSQQRFPQDPADSLYREARQLLNRGEWRKAAALFARVADHRPPSAYAADALYWQAFMLYRIGGTNELRQALAALDSRRSKYPNARSETEATTLATRIRGALASRGDRTAEAALARDAAAGSAGCDEEELSVRSSALSALQRSDPEAAQALLTRVLDPKDECSVPLRKNAVVMIGTKGDAAAKTKLA
jgi:tetratricopeptide (TPR) repeat protein